MPKLLLEFEGQNIESEEHEKRWETEMDMAPLAEVLNKASKVELVTDNGSKVVIKEHGILSKEGSAMAKELLAKSK